MALASSSELSLVFFVVLCLSVPTFFVSCEENFDEKVALFVFGDSLFDNGNNNHINTIPEYQANFPPYGQSYFNHPTGRYNDGRIIPDFIAEFAKLPLIPTYLDPRNNEFPHGANFASGGGGALNETKYGFVLSIHTQVKNFGDLANRYKQNLGDNKARKLISDAVYLFSIGGNDYISPNRALYKKEQYVDMVIGNITTAIMAIYEKGGRKFGFVTAPLIGCFPIVRIVEPGNSCNKEMNDISMQHNLALATKLKMLENELEGFMYAKFDFATAVDDRMKDPTKYGFKDGETGCCGSGQFRGIYSCGGMRGIKEYELCENATEHFFFDSGHPNEVACRQFADLFWNGDSKLTEAYNLKTLFEGKPSKTFQPNDEL